MIRRFVLALIVILCFSFFTANPALAGKSYSADRYDVRVVVQPDGGLTVTETVIFRFDGGPFTYVYRDLEYANLDQIDQVKASMDGKTLSQGTQAGQVEIAMGRPLKVTWHFSPTSDAAHELILTYHVQGAIRQDTSADTLIWRAIPETHDYSIASSTIRIEYPAGIAPLSKPSLAGAAASFEIGDRVAVFTTQAVEKDTPIDVIVHFPAGLLITQPPAWQALQEQKDQRNRTALPFGLGAAVLSGLLGLAGMVFLRQGFRRDVSSAAYENQNYVIPPKPIPAALAARLTGGSPAFLGTLFDLAQRGVLRIEERPKKWGSRSFEIVRQTRDERTKPHEQVFIDELFRKAQNERVALSKIAELASNSRFIQALDEELTAFGWRDAERSDRRRRFFALAGLSMGLGIAVLMAGLLLLGASPVNNAEAAILGGVLSGAGAGASGAGLVGLFLAAFISILTDEGVRQAAAWKSFESYLRNITRSRESVVSPDIFERYLPYAASFGMATEWVKFFQKMNGVPLPEWFQGLHTGLDDGSFVAIMAAITAADSSASSAASGAGGGASGGGASGAG
jgi:hypothetical protein